MQENDPPEFEAIQGRMQQSERRINRTVIEGDDDEYRRKVIAFAGRKMACADSFDTCSGNPIRPHEFESEALCTRRRYMVRVPA
jgi:hypothetical protein